MVALGASAEDKAKWERIVGAEIQSIRNLNDYVRELFAGCS
jgi:hypothetical protein